MQVNNTAIPRPEHPRPDFERKHWMNLNGTWRFDFDDTDRGEKEKWYLDHDFEREITVPFCYQSKLSGIGDESHHEVLWYQREFTVPSDFDGKRIFLHFGAVDYFAKVWVDGVYLGSHTGGYLPFKFDITDYVKTDATTTHKVTVRVEDSRSCIQPRGKQNWKDEPFGCWYTPVSGIWQTVWLEAAGMVYAERVRITPNVDERSVFFETYLNSVPEEAKLQITISYQGEKVNQILTDVKERCIRTTINLLETDKVDAIHYWWPSNPCLYDVDITVYSGETAIDQVSTYFGMRKVHCDNGWVYINNIPFYQKLILDQGYWPDSLLTPPSDDAIILDIEMTKKFGYNGARKHQKIEDPRYYYWADKMGLLVWGELPSSYDFCTEEMENIFDTMKGFIDRDYNHPCIITWVPLNESWGVRNIYADKKQQKFARGLYHLIKALDNSRLVSTNDGWEQVDTDIVSIHDYTAWGHELSPEYSDIDQAVKGAPNKYRNTFAKGFNYTGQPVLCTEYGGIAFEKDSGNGNWGYNGAVKDEEEFLKRFGDITRAFKAMPYMRGYCYTQLTDVFHEVNGLMDMNRKPKVDPDRVAEINK